MKKPSFKGLARGALVVALLGFVGPRAAEAKAAHEVRTIKIEGMKFVPEQLEASVGDKIVWKNDDLVPHTATAEDKSFDSGAINQEKSWSYTVRKKGKIPYKCAFHPTMKGLLIVK